jgi:hypothetical protein
MNGQSRGTVNIKYARERTNKRKRNPRGPSRMENLETLSTLSTQDTGEINVREKRMGNQEWAIQKHFQH